jgi:hypothetical protein
MARYTFNKSNWTPVLVADTTNFTDNGYVAVQGGNTTMRIDIYDVFIGGAATSSAAQQLVISRDSTVGATSLTGVLSALTDPTATAPGTLPLAFSASTTKPQRSATLQLLPCPFNAFGGTFRWTAADMAGSFGILGNGATFGEISISSINAGTAGLVGCVLLGDVK